MYFKKRYTKNRNNTDEVLRPLLGLTRLDKQKTEAPVKIYKYPT
jgi:hypothetical protein